MATSDDIGSRGQYICATLLTDPFHRRDAFFRVSFLGDKWPTIDFLVELIGAGETSPFFFVQVKATRQGYVSKQGRAHLRVGVSMEDIRRMTLRPAPTYVVGIDNERELGYIIAVQRGMRGPIASLPSKYPLADCDNLELLWNEVKEYWDRCETALQASVFSL